MNKSLRVLMVEDSEDDAHFVIRELKRGGFEPVFERVETSKGLTSALDRQPWDLIISDHSMPGFGSLDALELVKGKELDIPFIVVSGAIGEDMAVKAMKAGASDYVMKSQLTRLVPTIERELREASSRRARRKAEEALRRGQQELADFFEHAAVGLRWEGPDGMILRVNQAELDIVGYTRDEYLGHRISEFCADEGVAEDILKRLHRGETLDNYEARLRCKNGTVKDVLLNSNVLWEGGKFIHSRCFTRDITERKRGAEAMAYLGAIVESSDDAIIGKTLDGTILSWNKGAERMYGYTADEVKGRSMAILIPEYRPEELPQIYARIKDGEWIERYETIRLRKDGSTLDVSLSLSPIKDAHGKVIGVSAIERDITLRKREEAERLKLIDELTRALANIRTLRGLLPICASCKKIRDDHGYWQKVESYISHHTEAEFTHGICPDCMGRLYPEYTIRSSTHPKS
ncbi:MAG: putative sensor protein [Pedosphaera sp.]|nr:putative sensor protein [Pedosphaera sp.]